MESSGGCEYAPSAEMGSGGVLLVRASSQQGRANSTFIEILQLEKAAVGFELTLLDDFSNQDE
jgi:hypothetical protein